MNDMPVPSGSWAAMHSARQTKNNMVLLAGVGLFAASLAYVSIIKWILINR